MACERVWEPEGVVAKYSGVVSGDDLLECVRRIQADARFDDTRYVIHDLSSIEGHGIGEATLTDLAVLHIGAAASCPNCRVVFVSEDAALADNIEKILLSPLMKSYEVKVRPSLLAARDWLDAQPQLLRISDIMGFLAR